MKRGTSSLIFLLASDAKHTSMDDFQSMDVLESKADLHKPVCYDLKIITVQRNDTRKDGTNEWKTFLSGKAAVCFANDGCSIHTCRDDPILLPY